MAAHRYWRALLRTSVTNNRVALKEFQLRTTIGGPTACTGGTIIASGSAGGQPATNAFDGNTATEWASGPPVLGHAWIGYDFGSPVDIAEVMLITSGNEYDRRVGGYLQYSDDGASWGLLSPGFPETLGDAGTITLSGFAAVGNSVIVGSKITLNPGWPTQAINAQVRGSIARIDVEDGGPYRIAGTTEREVTPGVFVVHPYRRVRLFERLTGRLVREQWSDPLTGAYEFSQIKLREYILLTDDHARYYNAVAADLITPVL